MIIRKDSLKLLLLLILFTIFSSIVLSKLYPTTYFPADERVYSGWVDRTVDDYYKNKERYGIRWGLFKTFNDYDLRGKNTYILLLALFKIALKKNNINIDGANLLFLFSFISLYLSICLSSLALYLFSRDLKIVIFNLIFNIFSPLNFAHLTMFSYPTLQHLFINIIVAFLCLVLYELRRKRFILSFVHLLTASLLTAFSIFTVANIVLFVSAIIVVFSLLIATNSFIRKMPYYMNLDLNISNKIFIVLFTILLFVLLISFNILLIDEGRMRLPYYSFHDWINAVNQPVVAKPPILGEMFSLIEENKAYNHFSSVGIAPYKYRNTFVLKYLTNIEPFFIFMIIVSIFYIISDKERLYRLFENIYAIFFVGISILSIILIAQFKGYPLLRSIYPFMAGLIFIVSFVLSDNIKQLYNKQVNKREKILLISLAVLFFCHLIYSGFFVIQQYNARYSLLRFIENQSKKLVMLKDDPWKDIIPLAYPVEVIDASDISKIKDDNTLLLFGPRRYFGVLKMDTINSKFNLADLLPALKKLHPITKLNFYSHDPIHLMQCEISIYENYYKEPSWFFKKLPIDDDYKVLIFSIKDLNAIEKQ